MFKPFSGIKNCVSKLFLRNLLILLILLPISLTLVNKITGSGLTLLFYIYDTDTKTAPDKASATAIGLCTDGQGNNNQIELLVEVWGFSCWASPIENWVYATGNIVTQALDGEGIATVTNYGLPRFWIFNTYTCEAVYQESKFNYPAACPPRPPRICRTSSSPNLKSDSKKIPNKIFEGESETRCTSCNPEPWETQDCNDIGGTYDWTNCECGASPIVIDISGDGFKLTDINNGIRFDINGDGAQELIAWTAANMDDAWLVLDRNGNGKIDDGKELFGNNTLQSNPLGAEKKNGFLALAEFDKPANGGNNDGIISVQDTVFTNLRLWQDTNHNGISEADELKTITQLGLVMLDLDYRESKRTDEFGNRFKYKAKVKDIHGAQTGRWAWDVFLLSKKIN